MTEQEVVRALAALAQQSRLQIFRQLVVSGNAGMTPSQLSETLHCLPTALSFHLKELTRAGLTSRERDGRNLIYCADFLSMNALLSYLTANCCSGKPCALDAEFSDCNAC